MRAEGETVWMGMSHMPECIQTGDAVTINLDALAWTRAFTSSLQPGAKLRRLLRRTGGGTMRSVASLIKAENNVSFEVKWGGAEHNMDHDDDARLTLEARCNYAVDHGAGCSASEGKQNELAFFNTHRPPPCHSVGPAFFSTRGSTIYDDPAQHVKRHVGARAAALGHCSRCAGAVRGVELQYL